MSSRLLGAFCLLASMASAQVTNTNALPGNFVDISMTGGTAIPAVYDDSYHTFASTVGNALFPAGTVTVTNNGAAYANGTPGNYITYSSTALPAAGIPSGFSPCDGILCPLWGDLYPTVSPSNTTLWHQEIGGTLYIMWLADAHFGYPTGGTVTFEIQVFSTPGPNGEMVQFLYPDATFGPTVPYNNGLGACVGWSQGIANGANSQYEYSTANTIPDGTVVTFLGTPPCPMNSLTLSSPLGAGSFEADFCNGPANGTYFIPVTVVQGLFPNGWAYGLDISIPDLVYQYSFGFPFTGALDATGGVVVGPFGGLPPGITIYCTGILFNTGSTTPNASTGPRSLTI